MTETGNPAQTVAFTEMKHGSRADYDLLDGLERHYSSMLPDRLLAALARLGDGLDGYQISRLQHSLQAATRAERDGADIELIVAALVHDLGDELSPDNHSQVAAAILRPYVRAEVTWVVEMHGLFQMVHYAHHRGLDRNGRDVHRDHEWYDSCVRFCERWDQAAFDPEYPTEPLEHFEAMLREVFTRTPFDPATGCL